MVRASHYGHNGVEGLMTAKSVGAVYGVVVVVGVSIWAVCPSDVRLVFRTSFRL